jgi:hypothetical protein
MLRSFFMAKFSLFDVFVILICSLTGRQIEPIFGVWITGALICFVTFLLIAVGSMIARRLGKTP